jgi:hypothetical protein
MNMLRSMPLRWLGFLLLCVLATFALAEQPPTKGVHLTRIGHPTWKPVDFHLYLGADRHGCHRLRRVPRDAPVSVTSAESSIPSATGGRSRSAARASV